MRNLSKTTTFNKMTEILVGVNPKYFRRTNKINKYMKIYDFADHFKSVIYLQFSGSDGLRDFTTKFKDNPKVKKMFKIPSVSQLSRLNKRDNVSVFREIFLNTLSLAHHQFKDIRITKELKDIKIIDSTLILIGQKKAPTLAYQNNKSAIRISTLISHTTNLPEKITIVPALIGERSCIEDYVIDSESIYLFDRGYYKYSWYDEMSSKKIRFITRQTSNSITEEYSSKRTGKEDLYDSIITMGSDSSKNKTKFKYREILYFENGEDEEFRLVTNIFNIPAQDIISLYKQRWSIESFFKWIKQHLTIKHWIGHTLEAISIQIYCALIIYILLLLIKYRFNSKLTLFDILRKLRVNLNENYALKNILSG